jgi:DNA-binding transcriptional ArsR family regulator
MPQWGFMTNHMHALYCVARHPGIRIFELAECVGVRERAAHRLVTDLVEGGYLTRRRVGTRNFYELHPSLPLRREGLDEVAIGEILEVLLRNGRARVSPAQTDTARSPDGPATRDSTRATQGTDDEEPPLDEPSRIPA